MALFKSDTAAGRKPGVSITEASGGVLRFEYTIAAALVVGDVIHMGDMPANNTLAADATLISDDLDSNATPTIVLAAGILNAGLTAMGAGAADTWIAASTIGQAGGVARASANAMLSGGTQYVPRPLGVVVSTGAATAAMVGKKIVLTVTVTG